MNTIAQTVSCVDGYDPDALRVDKAAAAIRACLSPVTEIETVAIRDSLGRVLAQDIVPQINVPGHDNSAMDGYAVRFSDLNSSKEKNETILRQIGTALAGKMFNGEMKPGECVRVMTGAVMPQGADTVVVAATNTHVYAPDVSRHLQDDGTIVVTCTDIGSNLAAVLMPVGS